MESSIDPAVVDAVGVIMSSDVALEFFEKTVLSSTESCRRHLVHSLVLHKKCNKMLEGKVQDLHELKEAEVDIDKSIADIKAAMSVKRANKAAIQDENRKTDNEICEAKKGLAIAKKTRSEMDEESKRLATTIKKERSKLGKIMTSITDCNDEINGARGKFDALNEELRKIEQDIALGENERDRLYYHFEEVVGDVQRVTCMMHEAEDLIIYGPPSLGLKQGN